MALEVAGLQAVLAGVGAYIANAEKVMAANAKMNASFDHVEKSSSKLGSIAGALAKAGVAAGAFAAIIGGVATVKAASFETTLARIDALTNITAKDSAGLGKAILEMAKKIPVSPAELGAGAYFILSSGINDVSQALAILEAGAKASVAGLGKTSDIVGVVTSVMNAYGPAVISAAQATDILVQTVKEGKGEPAEFAQALGLVIPVAATAGASFAEVGAFLAMATNTGSSASEAVTQLRGVLSQLLAPGEKAKKQLEELGFSAQQVRDSIKKKGLIQTLLDLKTAFKGDVEAMDAIFPDVRGLIGFLSVIEKQGEATKSTLYRIANSAGVTDKAFRRMSQTTEFQVGLLKNQLSVALIQLGQKLLPTVNKVLKFAIAHFDKFTGAIATVATAIGKRLQPVLRFIVRHFGDVKRIIGEVVTTVQGLGKALMGGFTGTFSGGSDFEKFAASIGRAAQTAREQVEKMVKFAIAHFDEFTGAIATVATAIGKRLQPVLRFIVRHFGDVKRIIGEVVTTVQGLGKALMGGFTGTFSGGSDFEKFAASIGRAAQTAREQVEKMVHFLLLGFQGGQVGGDLPAWSQAMFDIGVAAHGAWVFINDLVGTIGELIHLFQLGFQGGKIGGEFTALQTAAFNAGQVLKNDVLPAVMTLLDFIGAHPQIILAFAAAIGLTVLGMGALAVVAGLASLAVAAFGVVVAIATSPITLIIVALGLLILAGYLIVKNWDLIKAKAEELWNWLPGIIQTALTFVYEDVKTRIEGVMAIFTGLYDLLKETVQLISDLFHGRWAAVWSDLKAIAKTEIGLVVATIKAAFGGLPKLLYDIGKEAGNQLLEGLKSVSGFNAAKSAIGAATGAAKKLVGKSDGGIITSPTATMLGEGYRAEAVIPLTKPARARQILAALPPMVSGGRGGGSQMSPTFNLQGATLDQLRTQTIRAVDAYFRGLRLQSTNAGAPISLGVG